MNGECAFKTAFFNKFVFWNVLDISRSGDASATFTKRDASATFTERGRFGYFHEARTLRLLSRSGDASATITKRGRFGYHHEARTLRLPSRSEDASATTGIGIAKRQLRGIA